MNIYKKPTTPPLIFFNLKQQGEKTEHFTLEDATIEQVGRFVTETINNSSEIPKIATGHRLTIEWRYRNGKNVKSMSVAVFGVTPKQAKDILLSKL